MPKYTDEQIERAKNTDVRTFLEQTERYTFEGHGRFLKCKNIRHSDSQMPSSLTVDTHMNRIFYNSVTGNRPLSALDWCTTIKEMDFQSAMRYVLEEEPHGERAERPKYQQYRKAPEISAPKNLELSEKSDTSKNVYAYLTKTRGIPQNIVNDCLNKSLIYQDVRKNAVFVGYDNENKAKYAARRGTFTPDGREPFKRDCTGSDKNFAFRLEGRNTETVYVAEAAIDVLSLAALEDKFNGVGAYKEKTYLSTGGAGIDSALEQFCKTHNVKTINICFDDDEAGKNGMEKIMQKFRERGYTVNDMRASMAHDYNDELVAFNSNPNLYSKPPDVVKSVTQVHMDRNNPEQPVPDSSEKRTTPENHYQENSTYNQQNYYEPPYEPEPPYPLPPESEDYIPFDDYAIPDEQYYYEQNNESSYRERNDILPKINSPEKEINRPQQTKQPETFGIFSVEENGEVIYCKTDMKANELLTVCANSEQPFLAISAMGDRCERISQEEYTAEIAQSGNDKLIYIAEIDFNDNFAKLYDRAHGVKTVQISDYAAKTPEKVEPEQNSKTYDVSYEAYQERNGSMPEIDNSNREINQPEMYGLFSVEQNGEVIYCKTDMKANDLLNICANSEQPYPAMSAVGERISQEEYAMIEQRANFKFSVEFNLDNKSAKLYAVNMGKGGIAESDRTPQNCFFQSVNLSDYVKKSQEKTEPVSDRPQMQDVSSAKKKQEEQEVQPDSSANTFKRPEQPKPPEKEENKAVRPQMQNISSVKEQPQINQEEKVSGLLQSMKDRQENRRAELLDKISEIDSKIADRQERIDKLENKIADIEVSIKTAVAFKRAFGNTLFGKMIDNNIEKKQGKIQKIRNEKIPKQQDKITVLNEKKSKAEVKLNKVNRKIDKIDKVQDFLSAMSSKDRNRRHEGFVTGLDNLSDIRRENLENKLHKTEVKIDRLSAKYSSPDISHSERFEIKKSIRTLKEKASDLSEKIEKLNKLHCDLEDMKNGRFTEKEIENVVNKTADKISERFENPESTKEKSIINTVVANTVESGTEAVNEVVSDKERGQAEKTSPVPEREHTPDERLPDVSKTKELDILTMAAVVIGVNISEFNRLPAEIKADIISEFQENSGKISTEQLAARICEIADIEPPKKFKAQPVQTEERKEKENPVNDTQNRNVHTVGNEQPDDKKPLFSRSKVMSDEFKPTSSKSKDDLNVKKNRSMDIE